MPIATAPALLAGLGARILLDFFSRSGGPTVKDFILIGAWQGVALFYAMKHTTLGVLAIGALAVILFVQFNAAFDMTRSSTTVLGIVLGFLGTDFLAHVFDNKLKGTEKRRRRAHTTFSHHQSKRQRIVQFRASVEGASITTDPHQSRSLFSDITSVDSRSLLGSITAMSPFDREIAALRARASLADSERRRYKEERKWAVSQGNFARASQMKWEVKRYTDLMQKFHRDADALVLEASVGRLHKQMSQDANVDGEQKLASSSRVARQKLREPASGSSNPQRHYRTEERMAKPREQASGVSAPQGHTSRSAMMPVMREQSFGGPSPQVHIMKPENRSTQTRRASTSNKNPGHDVVR